MVEYLRIKLVMTIPRFTFVYPAKTIFFTILPYFLGIKISINGNKYIVFVLINDT